MVTDDQAATDTQTLSLTITGVNDAPIILGDFSGSATENEASVTGNISSSDTDDSSTASYSIENTTGKNSLTFVKDKIEENNDSKDLNKKLLLLVEKRIKLTRQKLNLKNINQ